MLACFSRSNVDWRLFTINHLFFLYLRPRLIVSLHADIYQCQMHTTLHRHARPEHLLGCLACFLKMACLGNLPLICLHPSSGKNLLHLLVSCWWQVKTWNERINDWCRSCGSVTPSFDTKSLACYFQEVSVKICFSDW